MIPVYVLTNEKHYWLLPGFHYLTDTFWPGQEITTVGYPKPAEKYLAPDRKFISINRTNYPAQRWTTGLITFLRTLKHENFILLLEDYWLMRHAKTSFISVLYQYMNRYAEEDKILRIDLSADRMSKKQVRPFTPRVIDEDQILWLVSPPHTPYQMSLQAAIWNRDLLLEVLRPNETAWRTEIEGTKRLKKRPGLLVLGTKDVPLLYKPVYRAHRDTLSVDHINQKHLAVMRKRGWLSR